MPSACPLASARNNCQNAGMHARAVAPTRAGIGRDFPPSQDRDAFIIGHVADCPHHFGALGEIHREETNAGCVAAGCRQLNAADPTQEGVGHLQQYPSAITAVRLAARCPAVLEID